jgi:hypothetical protein
LVTFFAAAKKVTAAPHRGSANKPTPTRDPATPQKNPKNTPKKSNKAKDETTSAQVH